ncbi:MAG: GTPase HflX [candidate division WOR-3 bacterium]
MLVGVTRSGHERRVKSESIDELAALTRTSGGVVVGRIIQIRPRSDPSTHIGPGKVAELAELCRKHRIGMLIFDEPLTPTQLRNLEDRTGVRVIDRTALILDIFAIHARTAEARVQVELAQLEYLRTRLTGMGVQLSRLGGGIGTRGPGETQLESDKRSIERRISALRRSLDRIDRERAAQRRLRASEFKVTLVGYTNAGKTTLFNVLAEATGLVSSGLFSTLDARTRVSELARGIRVVITDTVGFIRDLPAQLVASFRSTLSEIRDADLILHVVDASNGAVDMCIDAVNQTLEAIGAAVVPVQMVLTKADRVADSEVIAELRRKYRGALVVSGVTGDGIDRLRRELVRRVRQRMAVRTFTVPVERGDLLSLVYAAGEVLSDKRIERRRWLRVRGYPELLARARKQLRESGRTS